MHFAAVRRYLYYRSGNAEVATDIAQDTFLKIWEKRQSVQPEKVKGLLFKIAGDLYVSFYRKEKRSFDFFNYYVFDETSRSPEENMTFNELKDRYREALENMPENQRIVFLMSRAENMKYAEIAQLTGIGIKAVEKRMKGALEHLRKYLKTNE